jgi:IstB-like ATP binding protein
MALSDVYGKDKVILAIEDTFVFDAYSSEYIANILEQRERLTPVPGPLHRTRRPDFLRHLTYPMKTAPDTSALEGQLDALRLPLTRQHYQSLATEAAREHRTHIDYLGKLIDGENALHADRTVARRIQAALFPVIKTLSAAQHNGGLKAELKKYLSPSLLILDEVGYLPIDQRGADLLFQVISQRYERGSIVLTTNKAFKQWPSIFNGDSTITAAVLDRLLHHAETVIIEGCSYRMKDRFEP